MATVRAVLVYNLLFMPVWAWLLSLALVATSELINRAKWTKAETLLQGSIRMIIAIPGVGVVLMRLPVLGLALQIVGKIDDPPAPPSGPADSSARALLPLLLLGSLTLSACTSAYTATAASLTAAEHIVAAAADQFPAIDAQKRKSIVEAAHSREEGAAALKAWDAQAAKIVTAIEGANASVKLAADGLKGVHDGLRDPKQLGGWIAPAIRVGTDLVSLLDAVGVHLKLGGN